MPNRTIAPRRGLSRHGANTQPGGDVPAFPSLVALDAPPRPTQGRDSSMKKEILINVSQPEECRIAIVEDGLLEELYIERASQDNYVGNIYKGRIVNLEPSIQAAFVDFGVGRNGFLHISDVEPQYFRQGGYDPQQVLASDREAREEDAGRV